MSTKPSILLVEDEENLHEALKMNLELEGYEVTSAFDGAAAMQAVQNEYFDLIILDVMIPQIDGFGVTQNIRLTNNEVPILILSAKNTSADRVLGLKKGADDYMVKPFNLEELLLRIHKLIDKNKKLQDRSTVGRVGRRNADLLRSARRRECRHRDQCTRQHDDLQRPAHAARIIIGIPV